MCKDVYINTLIIFVNFKIFYELNSMTPQK